MTEVISSGLVLDPDPTRSLFVNGAVRNSDLEQASLDSLMPRIVAVEVLLRQHAICMLDDIARSQIGAFDVVPEQKNFEDWRRLGAGCPQVNLNAKVRAELSGKLQGHLSDHTAHAACSRASLKGTP